MVRSTMMTCYLDEMWKRVNDLEIHRNQYEHGLHLCIYFILQAFPMENFLPSQSSRLPSTHLRDYLPQTAWFCEK